LTKHQSIAFVFPGQGSQSVGMLDAWAMHPEVVRTLSEANEALGFDLGSLIKDGPKETLALTTNTQPVMLAADVALFRVWMKETGLSPQALAGHSLGEYAALVASGVLTLSQALPLVRFRAQAMQDAVPVGEGAMAAVLGLDAQAVKACCEQVSQEMGQVVEAVNFNDPMQTVIAGHKAAVERASVEVKTLGAKRALPLPVSAPFHSSLMAPAADWLLEKLEATEFKTPQIPVFNNVDVQTPSTSQEIKDALFRQAFKPVRWVECIKAMKAFGCSVFVECGPGQALSGMVKRIDAEVQALNLKDPSDLETLKTTLLV
jgi:[acyl-carrier-protein] S-malonyltransferase